MITDKGSSSPHTTFRVSAAQINTTVGDIDGNTKLIEKWIRRAKAQGADLVAFPELAVTGYPPEDLVLYDNFITENQDALKRIASSVKDIVVLVGFVDSDSGEYGTKLYNSAAILHQGSTITTYRKIHLPNYGVFDERRYFQSGNQCPVVSINGIKLGINICEDIWEELGPAEVQSANGAQLLVNLNSSPYESEKHNRRIDLVSNLSHRNRAYTLYTNQVGGQDELVFDGGSMLVGPDGELIGTATRFRETLLIADINVDDLNKPSRENQSIAWPRRKLEKVGRPVEFKITLKERKKRPKIEKLSIEKLSRLEAIYSALVLGTHDYLKKTGFDKVIIAISGGVDSALVATIAVDAIGSKNVIGVSMPSRYSSDGSISDAQDLCAQLGIDLWSIPIESGHVAFEEMLSKTFEGTEPGISEENIQSRIRGNLMMSIANKFGWLVLTTGNKSEIATGYATLYGDMAGAYAVIKDVPKTVVYDLCHHRNENNSGSPIPSTIIEKPPSAELRPGQLDEDSLPPYDQLDRVIHSYIEQRLPPELIAQNEQKLGEKGASETEVKRIVSMIDLNEYKRRQAPPGVKITGLAFGRDRRLPIASRWKH